MKAGILTVGDELLIGKITNTNASYMARKMTEIGVEITGEITVPDSETEIKDNLATLLSKSDIVVVCGGLGVTEDDKTKSVIAEYCNLKLILNEEVEQRTIKYYAERNIDCRADAQQFNYVPDDSTVLMNDTGLAPGFVIEQGRKKIAVFPGPPRELIPMFDNYFMPILKDEMGGNITTKYFKIFGLGELNIVEAVKDLFALENKGIHLATYCGIMDVALVLRYDEKTSPQLVEEVTYQITERFGRNLYSFKNQDLEGKIFEVLNLKDKNISIAESITGGMISDKFIGLSGISKYFLEGIVAYSNGAKISRLGVDASIIEEHSAVSKECAEAMCKGLLQNPFANYVLATTGYASGSEDIDNSRVGECYIGIGTRDGINVHKHQFRGNREAVREACTKQALFYLLNLIKYNEL